MSSEKQAKSDELIGTDQNTKNSFAKYIRMQSIEQQINHPAQDGA